jgi:L-amino acid N-acyltransferase YncA
MFTALAEQQAAFDNRYRDNALPASRERHTPQPMTARIRVAMPEDAASILDIYAPYCTSSLVSFEVVAPSESQMRERISRITVHYPWLVAEIDDRVAGYVYASQHRERAGYRWAVDAAVYVAQANHRRNVGRALYTTLFSLLREQGLFQAYAGITLPNPASVGLHEAVGFEKIAVFQNVGYKLGRWLDVGWWRLQLMPPVENPREPRRFSDIRDTPAFDAALAEGVQNLEAARR